MEIIPHQKPFSFLFYFFAENALHKHAHGACQFFAAFNFHSLSFHFPGKLKPKTPFSTASVYIIWRRQNIFNSEMSFYLLEQKMVPTKVAGMHLLHNMKAVESFDKEQ